MCHLTTGHCVQRREVMSVRVNLESIYRSRLDKPPNEANVQAFVRGFVLLLARSCAWLRLSNDVRHV